jgi:hypothetical protein
VPSWASSGAGEAEQARRQTLGGISWTFLAEAGGRLKLDLVRTGRVMEGELAHASARLSSTQVPGAPPPDVQFKEHGYLFLASAQGEATLRRNQVRVRVRVTLTRP